MEVKMSWSGVKIKDIAKTQGISIIEIASQIGVSRQTVNDWIKGQIPKGNHLLSIAKILNTSPNSFFQMDLYDDIIIPLHRQRKKSRITDKVQQKSLELAAEYKLFFTNNAAPSIIPVIRMPGNNLPEAKIIANQLRNSLGSTSIFPITYHQTFQLLKSLGIYVIFQNFPADIKSYAFYTKIMGNRVVFVNNSTNIIDLIFPLLHEAIHAMRDEVVPDNGYDELEEKLCDEIASYIQFTDEYVKLVYDTLVDLPKSTQLKKIKNFGKQYSHSLFGIVKRIKKTDKEFLLDVGGADTNLKKEFTSIGNLLNSCTTPGKYISLLENLSPLFISSLCKQVENISDRKLSFLLGLENSLDIIEIRKELTNLCQPV
jgi:transcriptional regulator with XRE-family HTH domain